MPPHVSFQQLLSQSCFFRLWHQILLFADLNQQGTLPISLTPRVALVCTRVFMRNLSVQLISSVELGAGTRPSCHEVPVTGCGLLPSLGQACACPSSLATGTTAEQQGEREGSLQSAPRLCHIPKGTHCSWPRNCLLWGPPFPVSSTFVLGCNSLPHTGKAGAGHGQCLLASCLPSPGALLVSHVGSFGSEVEGARNGARRQSCYFRTFLPFSKVITRGRILESFVSSMYPLALCFPS